VLPEAYSTEGALLAGAAAGELEAVRALLDVHAPVVYGFVFARLGGNEQAAEDVLQETLLEAVRSAHTFRGEAALTTWLCAIARRRLARHYETERRAAVARSGLVAVVEEDPVELRDEVIRALGRLPPLHRQALTMKYLDDLSVEEIAAEVGRTRVQVQSLLQRARAGLREELEAARGSG
jgi:RNA polymerase sigma-70 factor (ECF subfamily)